MEEVNQWVQQLRRAYNKDELQSEIKAINRLILEDNFRKYFKNKDKSTESLPSGRHMGHYKAILANNILVSLITAMINIDLSAGIALEQWKTT